MNTATLSALAEPNRVNIIELLRDAGAHTVGEIAQQLGLRLPQSSKHLRVLTDAGLVQVQAIANRRIYMLRTEQFTELDSWLKTFISVKEEQFERFDAYLNKLKAMDQNQDDK
ncbi:transcriptional regulator [Paenibacillus psychroresistens]|uniref:Transcriptional regulator n=1 Tax=Paenibacillus psychroresistens TaxID=1778678 RepID=A0A6B8RT60_9BACL|nr:metalloregulator ArsR/SmtB family transcription factor [Paenibacillus psychroresistens]QGQ99099.1 transcriptional regulator [Paenibacillus psychroresistens]